VGLSFGCGVGGTTDDLRVCVAHAKAAEAAGLDSVGYGDTQVIYRDFVSVLTGVALETSRIDMGPTVTNPLTRSPVVLANAMATIDEVSGGRAYTAIGLGASATANAGMDRAKPSQLAQAVHTYRSAFRDAPGPKSKTAPDTSVISIKWARREPPVVVHASGPLGRRVAAEHGDALLVRLGDADWSELPDLFAQTRQMHAEGPRAELPFKIWVFAPMALGEVDPASALAGIISARAKTLKPETCPAELVDAVRAYHEEYDYKYHASVAEPRNLELMDRLGLTPYMNGRFSLSGAREKLLEQFASLERAGADRLLLSGVDDIGAFKPLIDAYRLGVQ